MFSQNASPSVATPTGRGPATEPQHRVTITATPGATGQYERLLALLFSEDNN